MKKVALVLVLCFSNAFAMEAPPIPVVGGTPVPLVLVRAVLFLPAPVQETDRP
jgi:hypothetical protein